MLPISFKVQELERGEVVYRGVKFLEAFGPFASGDDVATLYFLACTGVVLEVKADGSTGRRVEVKLVCS